MEQIKMIFDFCFEKEEKQRRLFVNPETMLIAHTVAEVRDVFTQMEVYQQQGYYIAGYVAYEAAAAFDPSLTTHKKGNLPLVVMGVFPEVSIEKHSDQAELRAYTVNWNIDTVKDTYEEKIAAIKQSIAAGDTYQVNYTIRMKAEEKVDGKQLYDQLANAQQANYCALLQLADHQVISASPELFFELKEGSIRTKPMKGTIKRGRTKAEDAEYKRTLTESEKDQAENLMIVDLLRNDLSKIASVGSVDVPKLFEIESYPTVYQMTSTITAKVKETVGIWDIFKALFPCGSITGAPKKSTMEIIKQLEESPRGIYCGSIGFLTPDGDALFNVAIRTAWQSGEHPAVYGIGGGITWDSDAKGEYEEALSKAAILKTSSSSFQILETMKYDGEDFLRLDRHLARMKRTAGRFQYACSVEKIKQQLADLGEDYHGEHRVRLLLEKDGDTHITFTPLSNEQQTVTRHVAFAASPIDQENVFYYYKTTSRQTYDAFRAQNKAVFDVLLWNEKEQITEFTIGNIVVKWQGDYFTPPVSAGLLAGTFREELLEQGKIKEKILWKKDIYSFEEIWLINSVRGWVRVTF